MSFDLHKVVGKWHRLIDRYIDRERDSEIDR